MITKSDKKIVNAWAMYDWANSVYSLLIISAIFPVYYIAVTTHGANDRVHFLGMEYVNTALYSYAIAAAFLVIGLLSPLLSCLAGCSIRRKSLMKLFCYLGAAGCAGLFFFTETQVELAIVCSFIACLGYAGSLVFYFSYLPEIAHADDQEAVTTKGFAYGLIGSTLLLILSIIAIMYPQFLKSADDTLAVRISFLMVGIWWAGFAQIAFKKLPQATEKVKVAENIFKDSYVQFFNVWKELGSHKLLKRFLIAFTFYITSVQTVMYAATLFVIKELHMKDVELIPTIFIIQVVAIGGAFLAGWIAPKIGNIQTLLIAIAIWIGVDSAAYFVNKPEQFMILAFALGLGLGGVYALSRSTFISYIPQGANVNSYQHFYDTIERLALAVGMFLFGYFEVITGNMRMSVVFFTVLLLVGLILLFRFIKNPVEVIKEAF